MDVSVLDMLTRIPRIISVSEQVSKHVRSFPSTQQPLTGVTTRLFAFLLYSRR